MEIRSKNLDANESPGLKLTGKLITLEMPMPTITDKNTGLTKDSSGTRRESMDAQPTRHASVRPGSTENTGLSTTQLMMV